MLDEDRVVEDWVVEDWVVEEGWRLEVEDEVCVREVGFRLGGIMVVVLVNWFIVVFFLLRVNLSEWEVSIEVGEFGVMYW